MSTAASPSIQKSTIVRSTVHPRPLTPPAETGPQPPAAAGPASDSPGVSTVPPAPDRPGVPNVPRPASDRPGMSEGGSRPAPDRTGVPSLPPPLRAAAGWLGRRTPGLAAGLAEAMFLTPPRFRRPPRERRWLAGAERRTVRDGGRRIAAWSWGDPGRPAVLLVHGWAGRGSQLGAFAGCLAAAGLRAIAFDAPGHGDSSGRRSSLLAMSDAVLAVADGAGPIAGVLAHSAGSAATTWALRRGLPARRLVYVAPPAELSSYALTFGDAVGLPAAVAVRMQRRIERRFGVRWEELHGLEVAHTQRAPLLVIHDRDDAEVALADGAALAEAWPGARLLATSGLGHRRVLREPDVLTAAIDFLTA